MLIEAATSAIFSFISLISAAFTKIMLVFMAVLMVFMLIPQSRAANMFIVAVLSSFIGGTLIHVISEGATWEMVTWVSVSFGVGLMVFPFLMIFSNVYNLLSQDKELHQEIYITLKQKFTFFINNKINKDIDKTK
jgi:hypothetical protein